MTKPKRLWDVDPDALRKARRELGIRHEVSVKSHFQKHTDGTYGGLYPTKPYRKRDRKHRITIATNLAPEDASETLWHELTHASQRERYKSNGAWNVAYEDAMEEATGERHLPKGDKRYKDNPFEVEAKQNERRNRQLPLCVKRSDG